MVIAAALPLLAVPPALAQFGNSGFLAPDTKMEKPGVPAPHQPNNTDVLFVMLVGEGGLAEVSLGNIVKERSRSDAIEVFAARMVSDHSKANDRLKSLAESAGLAMPSELNAEHKDMQAKLEKMEGAEFDLAYISGQVVDHVKAAQLLAWEIDQGQDAALQKFAAETLPTVLEHLRMAQDLLMEARPLARK